MDLRVRLFPVVAVLLVAPVLAGCIGGLFGGVVAEAPAWQPGYTWTWRADGEVRFTFNSNTAEGDESGTASMDLWTRTATVLGDGASADGELVWLGLHEVRLEDGPSLVALGAARQRDLADVPVAYVPPAACSGADCSVEERIRVGQGPSGSFLDFPLRQGASWDVDLPDAGPLRWTAKATVKGIETVEVPAGTAETARVDLSFEAQNVGDLEDALRAGLEGHEGIRVTRLDIDPEVTVRLYYSEEHQNAVLTVGEARVRIALEGETGDGQEIEANADIHVTLREELVSYDLTPRPDLDLARVDALPVVGTEVPTVEGVAKVTTDPDDMPGGDASSSGAYGLAITGVPEVVNVAEADPAEVTLTARPVGRGSLPDGHRVVWSASHPDTGPLDVDTDGAGDTSATFTLPVPGNYTVKATAVDTSAGNAAVAADQVGVLGDYDILTELDCDVVALGDLLGSCPTHAVPVATGVRKVEVSAQPDDTLPARGTLVLLDGDGEEVASDAEPTPAEGYQVLVEGFDPAAVGTDWTVEWRPEVLVDQDIDIAVFSDYGGATRGVNTSPPDNSSSEAPSKAADGEGAAGVAALRGVAYRMVRGLAGRALGGTEHGAAGNR